MTKTPKPKHPAPWMLILDGEGARVYDAEKHLIQSIAHQDFDQISLWSRIVDAVNAQEERRTS